MQLPTQSLVECRVDWLRLRLVLHFLWKNNLARLVLEVQPVTGWVSAINVSHSLQMVSPGLLGIGQSVYAWCSMRTRVLMLVDWSR